MNTTPEIKKITQKLRCLLTDEEKICAGKELAEATESIETLENDKAQIVADFKAKITAAQAQISVLSNKLRSGYEFRDVACELRYDVPAKGQKQVFRLDTKKVVETAPMTEEEKQRQLPLEEPKGETVK